MGNRLKTVQKNGAVMAEFLYDGDGTRVQSTINGVTTRFVGEYYEVTDSSVTKYYGGVAPESAGAGMRKDGALSYLLSDHLGSNSLILDTAGNVVGETRYTAWGEERYSSGSVSTDYTYTGQYSNTDDFGLMYYKARWYDPQLGRFAQADSIVSGAGNPVAWDRYAYVENNPVIYNDPSGHCIICAVAALVIGAIVNSVDINNLKAGEAANVNELIVAGLLHEDQATIVGEGLESLQADPSLNSAQKRELSIIRGAPNYGNEAYSPLDIPDDFTANGPTGNWKIAAVTNNQAFWMVHTGTLTASNIQVDPDGTIFLTWNISDYFDFIPGPNHSDEYNKYATIVHYFYNEVFGAEETYPTDASWSVIISPLRKTHIRNVHDEIFNGMTTPYE